MTHRRVASAGVASPSIWFGQRDRVPEGSLRTLRPWPPSFMISASARGRAARSLRCRCSAWSQHESEDRAAQEPESADPDGLPASPELLARIGAYAERLRAEAPWSNATRTDAVRALLSYALDRLEAEGKGRRSR
jgi:hypothetical protein